jgi:hypothetical protein
MVARHAGQNESSQFRPFPQHEELESVLEGWVLVSIADHSPIPDIDGNRLDIREVA